MCTSDTTLIYSYWIANRDHKHADFNNRHVCRNFSQQMEWAYAYGKTIFQDTLARQEGVTVDLMDFPENMTMGGLHGSRYYL
jgi:hypothetical protein